MLLSEKNLSYLEPAFKHTEKKNVYTTCVIEYYKMK